MPLTTDKLRHAEYRSLIERYAANFSSGEQALLVEIINRFDFDAVQEQALAQAVLQQSRFDPDAGHLFDEDEEDSTGICPHCINPPMPPLRDYLLWRESRA